MLGPISTVFKDSKLPSNLHFDLCNKITATMSLSLCKFYVKDDRFQIISDISSSDICSNIETLYSRDLKFFAAQHFCLPKHFSELPKFTGNFILSEVPEIRQSYLLSICQQIVEFSDEDLELSSLPSINQSFGSNRHLANVFRLGETSLSKQQPVSTCVDFFDMMANIRSPPVVRKAPIPQQNPSSSLFPDSFCISQFRKKPDRVNNVAKQDNKKPAASKVRNEFSRIFFNFFLSR